MKDLSISEKAELDRALENVFKKNEMLHEGTEVDAEYYVVKQPICVQRQKELCCICHAVLANKHSLEKFQERRLHTHLIIGWHYESKTQRTHGTRITHYYAVQICFSCLEALGMTEADFESYVYYSVIFLKDETYFNGRNYPFNLLPKVIQNRVFSLAVDRIRRSLQFVQVDEQSSRKGLTIFVMSGEIIEESDNSGGVSITST